MVGGHKPINFKSYMFLFCFVLARKNKNRGRKFGRASRKEAN